jgi:hypothetical protein
MSWCADTDHGKIAKNTVLAVYWQPWVAGDAPKPFPVGAKLAGRLPSGVPFALDVIETDGDSAVVSFGATQWPMKRVEPGQLRFGPPSTPAGAPATYWVIGDEISN